MAAAEQIEVADAPDRDRYELSIDGELVGYSIYRVRPGLIAFVHTEVDERLEGRGLGDRLIRFALEDARARSGGAAVLSFRHSIHRTSSGVQGVGSRHLQGAVRLVKRYEGKHALEAL